MTRNYSKTQIYQIVCKDLGILDKYVGSTTDLIRRRQMHKSSCNNPNQKLYNTKLYKTIRDNGGWDNWQMIMVEVFPCKNREEAFKREREVYELLSPSLNKNRPHVTPEEKKLYYTQNSERIIECSKQYYADNTQVILEQRKKHYADNTEAILEQRKQYYLDNLEKIKIYQAKYQERKRLERLIVEN